jgi:hypothetical protein
MNQPATTMFRKTSEFFASNGGFFAGSLAVGKGNPRRNGKRSICFTAN